METKNERLEFASAIKYAFALRFGVSHSPNDVANIGIVFGGQQLATLCQEYIAGVYKNDELKMDITPGLATAKVELKEVNGGKIVIAAELNYDEPELMNFQGKTASDDKVALIFGFKHGCDYYITGNAKEKGKEFPPIVLSGFDINQ